jgi:hypothetical protein
MHHLLCSVSRLALAIGAAFFLAIQITGAAPMDNSSPLRIALPVKAPHVSWTPNKQLRATPITFKPIPMVDQTTGKAIAPSATATLKNGTTIRADQYFAQLNALEQKLNAQGLSLRTLPARIVISDDRPDAATLRSQADAIKNLSPPPDQATLDQSFTHRIVLPGGDVVLSIDEATPDAKAAGLQKFAGKEIFTENGIVKVRPAMPEPPKPKGEESHTYSKISYSHVLPFDYEFGGSAMGVFVSGSETVDGWAQEKTKGSGDDKKFEFTDEYHMKGDAESGCHIMGATATLARATASFSTSSDKNTPMTAKMELQVTGTTVYNFDKSFSDTLRHSNDGISDNVGFGVPYDVPVGPFDVSGEIGARGGAGLSYKIVVGNGNKEGLSVDFDPWMNTSAYGEIGVGINLGIVSASAGVGANLTLLQGDVDMTDGAGIVYSPDGHYCLLDSPMVLDKSTVLSGNFYVYVQLEALFGLIGHQWDWTIFDWSGITSSTVVGGSGMHFVKLD